MAGRPIEREREGREPAPGARGYSWRTAWPGNQLARKHGVWARDVDDEAAEVVGALFAPEIVDRYPATVLIAAQAWVRRRRALGDIEERGMVLVDEDGNARPHPLLSVVSACERTLLDLSKRFGLDPRSEIEIVRALADADRVAGDLDELRAAGRAAWDREVDGPGSEELAAQEGSE